jgi:hypothetical protein
MPAIKEVGEARAIIDEDIRRRYGYSYRRRPLYPAKRAFGIAKAMSAVGQKRTFRGGYLR